MDLGVVLGLCALFAVAVLLIGVVVAFMLLRRSPANADELAALRRENDWLRAEVERLKREKPASGSTDIQEL